MVNSMNTFDYTIAELDRNRTIFTQLLQNIPDDLRVWRPAPNKWNLHEVACHMLDEEREDFRARIRSVLQDPQKPLIPIHPESWPLSRKYMEKDYHTVLSAFNEERLTSVSWLRGSAAELWENVYIHDEFGPMSARQFLYNWLAHDYLHIRQVNRYKYEYFNALSHESLSYAGNW